MIKNTVSVTLKIIIKSLIFFVVIHTLNINIDADIDNFTVKDAEKGAFERSA